MKGSIKIDTLNNINKTSVKYSYNRTIVQLFQEQCNKTPNNTAIIEKDRHITYKEFNQLINRLGNLLVNKGVTQHSIVGVMMERSIEMIASVFAILNTGAIYLPIDPHYPSKRIHEIIKDSSMKWILTAKKQDIHKEVAMINLEEENLEDYPCEKLSKKIKPNDIAYIIYTSGSTGKPKGVMIEHHSLVNRIEWMQKTFPACSSDSFIQKTVMTFDVSIWEIFWWSITGASLCLIEYNKAHDPRKLCGLIRENNITNIHFVPSVLSLFIDFVEMKKNANELISLQHVFVSGERLDSSLVKRFYKIFDNSSIKLINLYGPTEVTIDVTFHICERQKEYRDVPIGKPIDNIRIYIVDEDNKIIKKGNTGELCIAGAGVASGYLNRPKLNKEKFPQVSGERVYKTGDMVKEEDGEILFLGRKDHQVKLRGLRIELEEIEYHLLKYNHIKEAVVMLKKDPLDNQYLCVYFVSNQNIEVQDIISYLKKEIPEYMVPTLYKRLDAMPIKINGKIDRNKLPDPFK
ncbi:amino acid adenylation domain-containing protein [Vallitalea maricola]|uniref:Amino acid adenylation domain-containing protein n=1 Tax=Vallitalea maricola TaxID=3074433 RepID=A0ACB5UJC9_9FIRM|nr:amino acid adenylation domain-containing protein [Vallitalea sp. AN17-2]